MPKQVTSKTEQVIPANELVPISSLKPNPANPRTIHKDDFERLKRQLSRLKAYKPIVVDTRTGYILGGHMRARALEALGIEQAWVSYVETASDSEALEYMLSDNDAAGRYDDQALAELVAATPDIELGDYKVDLGDPVDLKALLDKFGPEDEAEEDEVPGFSQDPPKSILGTVYQLGRHRLMCGDATNIEHVEQLMDGSKADMVFADPPYGMNVVQPNGKNNGLESGSVGITGAANRGTYMPVIGDGDIQTAVAAFVLCSSLKIPMMVFWGANFYASHLPDSSAWIVWNKENGEGFFADAELAWTNDDKQVRMFSHQWKGMIRDSERGEQRVHPTQKPVALAVWVFENYGMPKSVLDLFGGSGSTLIACEQTDRTAFLMEIAPEYVDVIRRRYWKLTHDGDETGWEEGTPVGEEAHVEAIVA